MFHWQNLDEKPVSHDKGSLLRHGRAWWHVGRVRVMGSWLLGRWNCRAELAVHPDSEDTFLVGLAVPGLSAWLGLGVSHRGFLDRLNRACRRPDQKYGNGRRTGFAFHGGALWWHLWADDGEWRRTDSRWRYGHLNFADAVLGRQNYSERALESRSILVPMPEGSYAGTATLYEARWQRPRWPWPHVRATVKIEVPKGIPHAGKGENSWDCGDDATFGISCAAASIEEAIGKMVAGALHDRRRYGNASTQGEAVMAGGSR